MTEIRVSPADYKRLLSHMDEWAVHRIDAGPNAPTTAFVRGVPVVPDEAVPDGSIVYATADLNCITAAHVVGELIKLQRKKEV